MELKGDMTTRPDKTITHGFTLLRELNSQRSMGQFCDCVVQLHSHPGKVFLAHKSVLAAFSPVLASLLPRHGTLMDLNVPCLTPETLNNLLEYIYTGSLPPKSQEESMLSTAFYLQMEQLQQALRCREKATEEFAFPVQDKLSQKRRFIVRQSLDENSPVSPTHYPQGLDRPMPSSPTYEVVPVIRHVRASGNDRPSPQSHWHDRHSTVDAECGGRQADEPSHCGDPRSFLIDRFSETPRSKHEKVLTVPSRGRSAVSEEVNGRAGESEQLRSTDLSPDRDNKDHCMESAQTIIKDLAPAAECHQTSNRSRPEFNRCASSGNSRYASDINSIKAFNFLDSGKSDHLVEMFSDDKNFCSDKNSCSIIDTHAIDGSLCCQYTTNYCDVPLCLENSSSTDTSDMTFKKGTPDPDVWPEVSQLHMQKSTTESKPSEMGTTEKSVVGKTFESVIQAESYDLSMPRRIGASVYQGQVRYHCLLDRTHPAAYSSDSDSEQACPLPDHCAALEAEPASGGRSKPRPFQCSLCERPFSQRGSLNRHVRSHLGVRPYSCPRCTMTFSRQYRVTEHMRVHLRNYEAPPSGQLRIADMQV